MTAPPPSDPLLALAVGLAELRGELSTGLAEIRGEMALRRQAEVQTGQILSAHTAQLADHERKLTALERAQAAEEEVRRVGHRRLQAGAAVAGILAGAAAVVPLVQHWS